MKDTYETIELCFYKDLGESSKELEVTKDLVQGIMKANSVDYALEIVENQKRSYYEETYMKGYTLNLIIKKVDLHYVLKLLDQYKIGFFASNEEKMAAISENEINHEEENYQNDPINIEREEEPEIQDEQANNFVRIFFSIIFLIILGGDVLLSYWLYTIECYEPLAIMIIFTLLQLWFFKYFLGRFKKRIEHL